MTNIVRIFTDGSAIGNPGPGGWGAVVIEGSKRREMSGAFPWATISGTSRGGRSPALDSTRNTSRTALRFRTPDPRDARFRLSVAQPGMEKPARFATPPSRPLDPAHRLGCATSHSLEVAPRPQRTSSAIPRRRPRRKEEREEVRHPHHLFEYSGIPSGLESVQCLPDCN
jgi:hypothetical protein